MNIVKCKVLQKYGHFKFKEFNNINEIEKYKGKDLLIKREQAVKLGPDE